MVGQIHFYVLIYVPQTHRILLYLGMIGEKLVLGFRLYIDVCAVTRNIWQASLHLFFRSHGTPVYTCFLLSSNQKYIRRYQIQVEVTSVKHLFKFYMELDGISSTSFQVFDYADLKGKRQRNLKPFYFAWLNLRLPPRLHVTRARPYQGGSWECWGPPWISTFETWNIYWEYIYVIFLHTDIHTNSLVLIRPAQPTQKKVENVSFPVCYTIKFFFCNMCWKNNTSELLCM